jgi:ABC-type hemin transport system substrate-binding protein
VYATQKELIQRLDRAHIPYFNYEHRALPDIITTIRAVGARIGSAARGDAVALEMERSLAAIRASTSPLSHPTTMLVFGRDPLTLRNVYASGGYGFLHDMLEIAGGRKRVRRSSGSRWGEYRDDPDAPAGRHRLLIRRQRRPIDTRASWRPERTRVRCRR